jgi:hypothetical protein
MNRSRVVLVAFGACLLGAGGLLAVAVLTGAVPSNTTGADATSRTIVTSVAVMLAFWILVIAAVALRRSPSGALPAGGAPLFEHAIERVPDDITITGTTVAAAINEAGQEARAAGTVEDGIAAVRPGLRATLRAVLVAGGDTRETATERIDSGAWTDDGVAAAVCSESCTLPTQPFRERCRAWLFPERVARERVRAAVTAIAAAGDAQLPTIPGQDAPRNVPVARSAPTAVADEDVMPATSAVVHSRTLTPGVLHATAADGDDAEADDG